MINDVILIELFPGSYKDKLLARGRLLLKSSTAFGQSFCECCWFTDRGFYLCYQQFCNLPFPNNALIYLNILSSSILIGEKNS